MQAVELEHIEHTAGSLTATAIAEASADTLLTLPAHTFDGTEIIEIEFSCTAFQLDSTARVAFVSLWVDGSVYGRLWDSRAQVASNPSGAVDIRSERIDMADVGSGSKTWSIRAHLDAAGTFTVNAGAGGAGTALEARASIIQVA